MREVTYSIYREAVGCCKFTLGFTDGSLVGQTILQFWWQSCARFDRFYRKLEEVLTHLAMHGNTFSSSAAFLIHGSGMDEWWFWTATVQQSMGWGPARSMSQVPVLLTNYPLKSVTSCFFLVFPLFWPECLCTMTTFLGLREHSLATASHSPTWEPWSLLWLQQGGHRGAARVPTASELTLVFQTPGCPKHTGAYCSHPPLSPLKPKASKLISLAAYNRTVTILCVSAWNPLLLQALSLKQQRKAPAWRPRVKIIRSGFRSRLPPKPELAQCQALAALKP